MEPLKLKAKIELDPKSKTVTLTIESHRNKDQEQKLKEISCNLGNRKLILITQTVPKRKESSYGDRSYFVFVPERRERFSPEIE